LGGSLRPFLAQQIKTLNSDPATQAQGNWAKLLVQLLAQGQETYYSAGIRYTWIWHSFVSPATTLGRFIQAPLGPLMGYFPTNSSALRLADAVQPVGVNGSAYKVTSTWLIGANGQWNSLVYPHL